jgi:hypothetical protein
MYTERKNPTIERKKQRYILYSHVAWVLALSFFAALFFSVLCQWLMISYERPEFVFCFWEKKKNKSFFFSCHEIE